MVLPKLNFKQNFDFKIKQDKDTIFIYDIVRKKYLVLSPEEWVRQHWIHYFHLVKRKNISALVSEKKIEINGIVKRIDLLITERTHPKILLECKAPNISITQQHFEQIARYNSIIGSEEILLSNGKQHICAIYYRTEYQFKKWSF